MIREQINLFLVIFALLLPSFLIAQDNNMEFQIGKRAFEEYRYTYALPHLKSALKNGCCEANYYIGRIYDYEWSEDSSATNAIKYYKAGAECGDLKSMVAYSKYYFWDNHSIDTLAINKYLRHARNQEYGLAFKRTALLYFKNDAKNKLHYLKKADALGAICSEEIASCYYYDFHDYDSVLYYASRAIFTYGDRHDCMYFLGMAYYYLNDYKRSIEWLSNFCRIEDSSSNKSNALHILGRIYENGGHGINKDLEKAKQLYGFSALLDMGWSEDSKIRLLEIAASEDLSSDDHEKLMPYYCEVGGKNIKDPGFLGEMDAIAARTKYGIRNNTEIKNANILYITAYAYLNGKLGCPKDTTKAIEYYEKAVNQGSTEASAELGDLLYFKEGRKEEAHKLLVNAASCGNIKASQLLWSRYSEIVLPKNENNYAIHRNYIDAKLHDIENRAIKGEVGYNEVADQYLSAFKKGIFFTRDYQFNDTLYNEKNDYIQRRWPSYNSLDFNYRHRNMYKYTLDQAIRYYYEAGNYERTFDLYQDMMDHTELGELYMGLCFYYKRGAQESNFEDFDKKLGLEMIEDAANELNPMAMLILGNLLRKNGQNSDAVYWYRKASYYGNPKAMRNLALCYDKGLGTDVNKTLAKEWLKKAKELGDLKH